ncbi:MAG: hypothetical protein OEZ52_15550, partial [Candidatus Aminicenantes bacterium]|nr:hypothetical protein [Candidatus Aminicenantes bacterium]
GRKKGIPHINIMSENHLKQGFHFLSTYDNKGVIRSGSRQKIEPEIDGICPLVTKFIPPGVPSC